MKRRITGENGIGRERDVDGDTQKYSYHGYRERYNEIQHGIKREIGQWEGMTKHV